MAFVRDQRRNPRAGSRLGTSRARYDQFAGLGDVGFGTYSTFNQRDCAVPEVGLMPYPIDIRAGNLAKSWCDCVFGGSTMYAPCVDQKYAFYPWTALGKLERGWDWKFEDFIPTGLPGTGGGGGGSTGGGSTGGSGYTPSAGGDDNTMLIGGGLLLAAILLLK